MSTIQNYAGRTVDVMAYQGVAMGRDALLTPALSGEGNGGTICTGIQKLAQRFLLRFMTAKGSMPYQPSEGCNFMPRLLAGSMRTALDVYAEFGAAVVSIRKSMRLEELAEFTARRTTPPDDEILATAKLTAVSLTPGAVSLQITLTSRAGERREIILPLETTLRGEP